MTDDRTAMVTVYSASLPLAVQEDGSLIWWGGVRPWNGRELTDYELVSCFVAAYWELERTGSYGMASQAAFEWLSEHAR